MSLQRRINKRHSPKPTFFKVAYPPGIENTRKVVIEDQLPTKNGNFPDKGKMGGRCNRTACQAPGATWFNTSTRAYYCEPCATDITRFAKRADGFHICFPSTGDASQDAQMKFGQEYPQPCEACGGSEIEEVYAGHGTVYEIPCSECQKPKA